MGQLKALLIQATVNSSHLSCWRMLKVELRLFYCWRVILRLVYFLWIKTQVKVVIECIKGNKKCALS